MGGLKGEALDLDQATANLLREFLEAGTRYYKMRIEELENRLHPSLETTGLNTGSVPVTSPPEQTSSPASPVESDKPKTVPPPPPGAKVYRLPKSDKKKPTQHDEEHAKRVRRLKILIEQHRDELSESLQELGCEARCDVCPHPEKPTAVEQVKACLKGIEESLS
jgi:hypothetical protein